MFYWCSEGPLRPMRMVWLDYGGRGRSLMVSPRYEDVKFHKFHQRQLRRWPRLERGFSRVEGDRESRRRHPGKTGDWPFNMKARRVR